jgi:hypothetical protein
MTGPIAVKYLTISPGSFGSLPDRGVECPSSVFGEVLEGLDRLAAGASDDGQGRVPYRRKRLWRDAGPGSALILAASHVADIVQGVVSRRRDLTSGLS